MGNIITEGRRPRRARPAINYSKFDAPSPIGSDKDEEEEEEPEESSESEEVWDKDASSGNEAPARQRRSKNIIDESEEVEINDPASPAKKGSRVHDSDSNSKSNEAESPKEHDSKNEDKSVDTPERAHSPANEPEDEIPKKSELVQAEVEAASVESGGKSRQSLSPKRDAPASPDVPKPNPISSPNGQTKSPSLSPGEKSSSKEAAQKDSLDAAMFSDSD